VTGPRDQDSTGGPTLAVVRDGGATTPGSGGTGPSRYAPGTIVAGRYRLVALLGRGGMGEVYRADDLTLDQPIALKFLPDGGADPARLAQFHNELRVARQISHKNVCRLYDLGESDGRRFLTMEYVDGEDLAALLWRIGRFPQDRALAIARQLCAGVAAAHERGVIHRDLKPANVMIDGDGNVRVSDFGIATAAVDTGAELVGTPQYMAPEQLNGMAASTRTDIYALGLILFEIFTGKRAHGAKTIADLKVLHETGTVTTPRSIVGDLDPSIERAILRCLEHDPVRRPVSALAVAAALPGGDPLAAALAAGETPSPALLVAAAETDALPVATGLLAVTWIIGGVFAAAALAPLATLPRLVPLDKAPAVLADRAEQILSSLGFAEPRADTADGFLVASDYVNWIARTDPSPTRWARLSNGAPPALVYWYRTSPRDLVPRQLALRPTLDDPPPYDPDMHTLVLDTRGRLVQFNWVPPQLDPDQADPSFAASWVPLFDAAGLTPAAFSSVAPRWTPRDFADTRAAWEGPLPDQPDLRVRVEAAAYRGRPVSFAVIGPWSQPTRMQVQARSRIDRFAFAGETVAAILLLTGAVVMARQHIRTRRADVAGATRLAVAAFAIEMAAWVFGYHHVPDFRAEMFSLSAIASDAAFVGLMLWVTYCAFEPYCRRFWPAMLLGWSRLLAGHVRDSRLGRDLLIGTSAAVVWMLLDLARRLLPVALGHPPSLRVAGGLMFAGAPCDACGTVSTWSAVAIRQLTPAFLATLLFVVLRLITRRQWAAMGLGMVGVFVSWSSFGDVPLVWLEFIAEALVVTLFTVVIIRFGLLAALMALVVFNVTQVVPLTLTVRHWSATSSNLTLGLIVALAAFGYYASRGGRPLLADRIGSMPGDERLPVFERSARGSPGA